MYWVRDLKITDESDNIVFRSQRKEAGEALAEAVLFLSQKGNLPKKGKGNFWERLDKEFKEYFDLDYYK